jgi:diguanylate cyclase (GGDEF)-like protein
MDTSQPSGASDPIAPGSKEPRTMFGESVETSRRGRTADSRRLLHGQRAVLELLAKGAPVHETLGAIAAFSEASTPDMLASIMIYDADAGCLRRGGHASLPETFINAVDGLVPGPATGSCGTAAWRRSRVITVDVKVDPLWTQYRELVATVGIRAAWSTPILSPCDGRLLGVFGMYYRDTRAPAEEDLEIVDHFVHLAAISLERHLTDQGLQSSATRDALAGMADRKLLDERAIAHAARARESGKPFSLAFLDLDRSIRHNDSFGYLGVDRILRDVFERMASALEPEETLARFGGDEFVLLMDGPMDVARCRVNAIRRLFDSPLVIGRIPVRISFSCGIAQSSASTSRFEDLMREATVAAKAAKSLGRGRTIEFDASWHARFERERLVARALTRAVKAGGFGCEMQPIIDLQTGRAAAFEVLARLTEAGAEDIAPAEFIPVAEERGHVHAIGILMLKQACSFIRLEGGRPSSLVFNVNISAHQVVRGDFVRDVMSWVRSMDVEPSRICFEIPDTAFLEPDGPSHSTLVALKAQGFHLALDDFGAGHISFSHLRALPVDHVILHRSFTGRLPGDEATRALFRSVVAIARGLGMQVTAKGIQTEEQLELVRSGGCVRGQGSYWTMPLHPSTALYMWSDSADPGRRGPGR